MGKVFYELLLLTVQIVGRLKELLDESNIEYSEILFNSDDSTTGLSNPFVSELRGQQSICDHTPMHFIVVIE